MSKILNLQDKGKYIIRKVLPEDASRLIDYLKTLSFQSDQLAFGPGEVDITVEAETEFIEGVNQSSNQYLIVAVLKGQIIGNLTFTSGTEVNEDYYGELEVSVLKKYWRNRIALELMNSLFVWAKANGIITKLNLQVRADNKNAIALYKKLGFEVERYITRTFFVDDEFNVHIKYYDSYQMGKTIY